MPTTMIERVARAIAHSEGRTDWNNCLATARAAVAEMREPTVDMLAAAVPDMPDFGYLPDDFAAMIRYVAEVERVFEVDISPSPPNPSGQSISP